MNFKRYLDLTSEFMQKSTANRRLKGNKTEQKAHRSIFANDFKQFYVI